MADPAFSLSRPLVVRSPNWLGDAVMALPAVRNLKTLLGNEPLTVAAPEKLAALWEACPFVDQVISLTQPKNLRACAKQLRAGKFASALLLPNSPRTAAEALFAGIKQRIGYAKGPRKLLLTHAVPVPPRNPVRLHQRYYYIDLVASIGAPAEDTLPTLKCALETANHDRPVVTLCPGAEYGPAKRWPVENYLAVAKHYIEKSNARIILLGATGDSVTAEQIAKEIPGAENLAGKTSLGEFMARLNGSHLVFCNDSGSMHLASALGIPTVAVFGSTEPLLTGPLGRRTTVLRHHVPCSPCFLRECPIDFGCMKGVTPEMVIAAAENLLA